MKIRKSIILLFMSLLFGGSLFAMSIDSIVKSSKDLKTIKCFVTAINFAKHRKSEIQYNFAFKREGEKMKIEYISPRNMKGTKIALDGSYFYSYLPNMHRTTKRKINPNSTKNPGKDMGLFFYYMRGDFAREIKHFIIKYIGNETITIKGQNKNIKMKTHHFTFTDGNDIENIWFDDKTHLPVKIERYKGKKLLLEINVTNFTLNDFLDDSMFKL